MDVAARQLSSVGDAAFVSAFDMTLRDVRVHSLRSVTKDGKPLGTRALARIAVSHGPVAGEPYRIPEEERVSCAEVVVGLAVRHLFGGHIRRVRTDCRTVSITGP